MRANYKVELTSGLFLLMGIAALLWLAMEATDYGRHIGEDTYRVTARFTNVAELKDRAPVKIGGVTVGLVEGIVLDPVTFDAIVTMQIDMRFADIPSDTSASILTSGVLGDRYVGLEPGGALEALTDGDEIFVTQSAVVLENMLSKYLFSADKGDSE
ncbi:MAG: outer membrane lipid asymmetry maintenance protein MlaD [Lysobacterales bacterium]|jgi:phospholipid/cholesterol/gamma-HCH transport system substrate-binding protein